MKNFPVFLATAIIIAFALILSSAPAQQTEKMCGTMEHFEKQKKNEVDFMEKMQKHEEHTQQFMETYQMGTASVINIPVVVHVLWNDNVDGSLVTEQSIIQQIDWSNRDFAGANDHTMGAFLSDLKANSNIQFCLARTAPDGTGTTGIEWRNTPRTSFSADDDMKFYDRGGLDAWDPNFYLNIWVCNLELYGGYAQFPGSGVNATFGVVDRYSMSGSSATYDNKKNGGLNTHEIGHCFNLRHIWGDDNGACTGTDYVDDTPNQANATPLSRVFNPGDALLDVCSPNMPGAMYMNFMDYSSDNYLANFTPLQVARMLACFDPGGPLEYLANSTMCSEPTGCQIPKSIKIVNITTTTVDLSWTAIVDVSGYMVIYRKKGGSSWNSANTNTNSIRLTGLTRSTNYEFQVQTICSQGQSDFSKLMLFSTPRTNPPASLAAPSLVYPAAGATNIPVNLTLKWNSVSGASYYTVQYSVNADFIDVEQYNISGTGITLNGLAYNTTYYWRVKAVYAYISSDWSNSLFTTTTGTIATPVLQSPINSQQQVPVNPYLYWYAVNGAKTYTLQYSTSSSFATYVEKTNLVGTYYPLTNLAKRTTYYWRLKAMNDLYTSDWSTVWQFKTTSKGREPAEDIFAVNNYLSISCFPNPTSDIATFKIYCGKESFIKLTVYDILGREIAVLVNQTLNEGSYSYELDASQLQNGIYSYVVLDGNTKTTKTFVILK